MDRLMRGDNRRGDRRSVAVLAAFVLVNAGCLLVRPSLVPMLAVVSLYLLLFDLQYTFGAFFVGLERYRLRTAIEVAGQAAGLLQS